MVSFFGDYDTTETVVIPFNTFSSDDPSASVTITDLAAADVEIHKDGGTTQRSSDAGVTVTIDFDSITGNHIVSIDLSDNTDAGFYSAGSRYQVRMEGTTVDGATINAWIGAFSIGCTLRPATDGRTVTVDADGHIEANVVEISDDSAAADNLESACDNYSATRGLSGTALPDAAADAAGGLPISDAGGLDLDTLLATLTNGTYGLSAIETLVDDLESRLSAERAGYLDNLNGHTPQTGDSFARLGAPAGASIAADLVTINNLVDDLESRLTAARAGYLDELQSANVPADIDTLLSRLSAARAGYLDALNGHTAQTGDNYARLGAPAGASVSADVAAVKTDTGNLVTRITATLFSGITSLAEWLGLIAGKQSGDATARTELRATGAGSGTYDETADSQEAIRDRGDAAWTTGAGGSAPTVEEIRTEMDSNSTQLAAIVEDTGTTIPATLTTMEGKIDTLDTNVDTLITRLSAARAAYLDNLSGGAVALASAVATVDTVVDAIKAVTDALPDSGALTSISTATDRLTAARAAAIDDLIDGGRLDLLIDAIKAKTDNLPEGVKKNTELSNFPVVMVLSSDHVTPATGKTVTGQRSLDGGAFEAVTGAIAEVSNGLYQFDAAAADTNGDTIVWRFSNADCDDTWVTIKTEE